MDEVTVSVIKISKNLINDELLNLDKDVTKERMFDLINQFISVHSLNFADMMEYVIDVISLDENSIGDTSICYSDDKTVYQLCHLVDETNDINCVSSVLVYGKPKIYGDTVLIKSTVNIDSDLNVTYTPCSVTVDDVVDLMMHRTVNMCVYLDVDNSMTETSFTKCPLDGLDSTQYRYIEIPLFKFNLIMYIKNNQENINKSATVLTGNCKVNGPVIIANRVNEFDFGTVTKELLKKLIVLATTSMKCRQLDDKDVNNHILVNQRLSKHFNVCNHCKTTVDINSVSVKTCAGCYRVRYDSEECQKQDWALHKTECLYKLNAINQM